MMDYNLERFKKAQEQDYAIALQEIREGQKRSHWMWYIFPQLRELGRSYMSEYYGISGRDEAKAYLADPVLGFRLVEISEALMELEEKNAGRIFGFPDVLKLCSCMTLFAEVSEENSVFQRVLDAYYNGVKDSETLRILGATGTGIVRHL